MLLFQTATSPAIPEQYFTSAAPARFPEIVVITGFNTDIEFDGVVYHVQTEDKGLDTPLILSLVYVGGAILASKRSTYHDLLSDGFDPLILTERLQRQHKLICAAVKAGRINDLKRLSAGDAGGETAPAPPTPKPVAAAAKAPAKTAEPAPVVIDKIAPKFQPVEEEVDILALEDIFAEVEPPVAQPRPPVSLPQTLPAPPPAAEPARLVGKLEDDFIQVEAEGALHVSLLEEQEFHAGEVVTIRIRVSRGAGDGREAAANVPVTVKVLGTEFRPLILTTRSDGDGVATIHAWLPRFTKGRAAVLVRASLDGFSAELRRVIQQP
ncbi:MAG TPA: hypothetical protein VEX70_04510 [Pyrinomonadaceae bacterium]|nr:hypothetical protein [Pyrinomonadaceae bacterium]